MWWEPATDSNLVGRLGGGWTLGLWDDAILGPGRFVPVHGHAGGATFNRIVGHSRRFAIVAQIGHGIVATVG